MNDPKFNPLRDLLRQRYKFIEMEEDFADEDDGPPPGEVPSRGWNDDFIILDKGLQFVRKFEVVGMRWEKYFDEDLDGGFAWRLKVFFSDCPSLYLWNEEARDMLLSFGLPGDPPDGREQETRGTR